MTLFETANELQLRLDAASTADEKDVLLSRGRTVRDAIVAAKEHFEAAQFFRVTIGPADAPPLNTKAIRQVIGRFRAALSKSGANAFQQRPAATLEEVLAAQTRRVDQWVKSTWRESHAEAQELLNRASLVGSHGSALARTRVRNRASRIEAVLDLNPVGDREALEERLNAEGLDDCLAQVNELIEELRTAIAAIDSEQAAMPQRVKAAIERAASEEGLPLGEVTLELMAELQSAGVLDDLVVRRL